MRTLLSSLSLLFLITAASAVTVTVSSPSSGATVGSSFTLQASASSSNIVTGWSVYIDGNRVYNTPGPTSSISPTINVNSGGHNVVVRAWDATGAFGDRTLSISVSSGRSSGDTGGSTVTSGALPTPPSSAMVFNHIEDMSGFKSCSADCAGGKSTSSFWMAQHQGDPSMDGSSTALFNGGSAWANVLWYKSLGAQNFARNFLWDFYVRFDSNGAATLHTAEFDLYQAIGGFEFMIGSQCNFGNNCWDTWNQAGGYWVGTSIPCPRFSANSWHHIQWYMQRVSSSQYKYVTLVVDGRAYNLNQTQPGAYSGWGDTLGVQWQLDLGASGTDSKEWIDNVKLTIW